MNDEAYYWVYSRFLDWGYFDHPPMIALLIKSGYSIFHNELGVRFFIVLLNSLTLIIIRKLLLNKNDKLFYAIVLSTALLQLGGFIAVPDIPLVFFTALFFLAYQKFLQKHSLQNAIILGVIMSLMLYSKYHGVLIILFTLLSNLKLLKDGKAYIAVLICSVLFIPHLYWQYLHGFPSVQYHLFERSKSAYKVSFTLEYLGGQILFVGPLMGWLFLWCSFKYKTTDLFQRALKFSACGVYIFFLTATLKGKVEANWTVPAMVPLIILSHQYLAGNITWRRVLNYTVPFTLLLTIFVRILFFTNYNPFKITKLNEFLLDKNWAQKISEKSHGLPVVFINSYQKASKYWFYSGIPAFSLNTPVYRRNNYNFWPVEKLLQGNPVYVITQDDPFFTDSILTSSGLFVGKKVDSFYSCSGTQLMIKNKFQMNDQKFLSAKISLNKTSFSDHDITDIKEKLSVYIFIRKRLVGSYPLTVKMNSSTQQITVLTTEPVNLSPGLYITKLAISSCLQKYSSLNSSSSDFIIK